MTSGVLTGLAAAIARPLAPTGPAGAPRASIVAATVPESPVPLRADAEAHPTDEAADTDVPAPAPDDATPALGPRSTPGRTEHGSPVPPSQDPATRRSSTPDSGREIQRAPSENGGVGWPDRLGPVAASRDDGRASFPTARSENGPTDKEHPQGRRYEETTATPDEAAGVEKARALAPAGPPPRPIPAEESPSPSMQETGIAPNASPPPPEAGPTEPDEHPVPPPVPAPAPVPFAVSLPWERGDLDRFGVEPAPPPVAPPPPELHIGLIEVIVEGAPAPARSPQPPAPPSNLASRHHLRRF